MSAPVLWQYNFSNFNEKARWALDFKRVPHVRRSPLPGGLRAMAFSLRGTLPVLDVDGERINDSTRIIAALESRFPSPALYPDDPGERAAALELEDFFDEQAGHELRRAGFYEWLANPGFVSALLTTGRGRGARALTRMMLPGAMLYARRRYRIYPADVEQAGIKIGAGAGSHRCRAQAQRLPRRLRLQRGRPRRSGAVISAGVAGGAAVPLSAAARLGRP